MLPKTADPATKLYMENAIWGQLVPRTSWEAFVHTYSCLRTYTDPRVQIRTYRLGRTDSHVQTRAHRPARTDLHIQIPTYRFSRTDSYTQTRVSWVL